MWIVGTKCWFLKTSTRTYSFSMIRSCPRQSPSKAASGTRTINTGGTTSELQVSNDASPRRVVGKREKTKTPSQISSDTIAVIELAIFSARSSNQLNISSTVEPSVQESPVPRRNNPRRIKLLQCKISSALTLLDAGLLPDLQISRRATRPKSATGNSHAIHGQSR